MTVPPSGAGPDRRRQRKAPLKTAILSVRFDPAVLAAAARIADTQGITVSDWIRSAVRREEYRQRVKWLDGHRDELEVLPGSGRPAEPRAIPSSLPPAPGRTFCCPHISVGNAMSVSCGICGPLPAAA